MTSRAMVRDRDRLIVAGRTGYIEKPLEPTRVDGGIQRIPGEIG